MKLDIFPNHKVCVFCGEKPNAKNKEHVIPKWMMKKTGDLKRPFGWAAYSPKGIEAKLHIPFDQFTFPACEACNSEYAKLEASCKTIFEKLEASDPLSFSEIDQLLDWFDKVRIGMWLGTRYLNKGVFKDPPNFHIAKRVANNDRFLAIYRRVEDVYRCSGVAVSGPSFMYMPSAAGFVFNQLGFVTISSDYLLAKNMGWPFPKSVEQQPNGMLLIDMVEGTRRIKRPIYSFPLAENYTQIYQPIIRRDLSSETKKIFYDNDFIKKQCLNFLDGRGIPRVYSSSNREIVSGETGLINVVPRDSGFKGEEFVSQIAIGVLKTQNLLWRQSKQRVSRPGENKFSQLRNLCLNSNDAEIAAHFLRIKTTNNPEEIHFSKARAPTKTIKI